VGSSGELTEADVTIPRPPTLPIGWWDETWQGSPAAHRIACAH